MDNTTVFIIVLLWWLVIMCGVLINIDMYRKNVKNLIEIKELRDLLVCSDQSSSSLMIMLSRYKRRVAGLVDAVGGLRKNKHRQGERIKYLEYKCDALQESLDRVTEIYVRDYDNRRFRDRNVLPTEDTPRFPKGTLGDVLESYESRKSLQNPKKDVDL